MQQFAFALFNGIASGASTFLVAAGVTLIFGILKVMNFAHGAFFMLGAYIAYAIMGDNIASLTWLTIGSVAAGLAVGVCGLLTDRIVLRRIRGRDEHDVLIATFALMMMVTGFVKLVWGLDYHSVSPPPSLSDSLQVGGIIIPWFSVFIILVGVTVFILLDVGIHRLWMGKVLRSLVNDSWIVGLLGYNVTALYTATMVLAFFLAGLAGGLLLPNQSLSPGLADNYLLLGFVTCIIGGLGSVRGAFLAALMLGLVESISTVFLGTFPGFTVYLAMVLVLLLRPQGLFSASTATPVAAFGLGALFRSGRRAIVARRPGVVPAVSRDRGATQADLRVTDRGKAGLAPVLGFAVLLATLSLPLWANPGVIFIAGLVLIEALFALSWNFLFGYCGIVSFGHAAFFALGAYGVGFALKTSPEIPFTAILALVMAAGGGLAAIVGGISLRRSSGVYFAILTMALAEICRLLVGYSTPLGRDDGLPAIPRPVLDFGLVRFDLAPDRNYYWFIVMIVGASGAVLWWLTHSRFGRVLRSIRQDAERTSFIGVNIMSYRWRAFVVSGAVAALAGGLSAPWMQIVTPETASIIHSTTPMLNTLLGGAQSFWGPVIGAIAFAVIGFETRTLAGISDDLIGCLLLIVVLVVPGGVVGLLRRLEGLVPPRLPVGTAMPRSLAKPVAKGPSQ